MCCINNRFHQKSGSALNVLRGDSLGLEQRFPSDLKCAREELSFFRSERHCRLVRICWEDAIKRHDWRKASFSQSIEIGRSQASSLSQQQLDSLNARVFTDAFVAAK